MKLQQCIAVYLFIGGTCLQSATQYDVELFKKTLTQWQKTQSAQDLTQVMNVYETLRNDTIRPQWLQMARNFATSHGVDIEQLYQTYIIPAACPTPAPLPVPVIPIPTPTPAPTPAVPVAPINPPEPVAPIVPPVVPNPPPDPVIPVIPTPITPPTPEPQPQPAPPIIPPAPPVEPPIDPIPEPLPIPGPVTPTPQPPGTETTNSSDSDEDEFCLATFIASLIPEIKSYVQKKDPRKIPESFVFCEKNNITCRNTSCIFCQNRMDMVRFSLLRLQIAQKYLKQRSRQQR